MYEIYAYGNVDTLTGIFNAIAAIMGGDDYFGLVKTVGLTGLLVAAFAGLFTPGRFHGWAWLMGFLLTYYAAFVPRTEVVIVDKLGSQPPVVVGNVPIGLAFFGHYTSLVGNTLTGLFETAFQVIPSADSQLPVELTYQRNGVLFGNRLIQASRGLTVADPQLHTDLISFVHDCTLYDLQDGTVDPDTFARSTDIWSLMGNPSPARFSTYGNPAQVDTCPNAYAYLASRLPAAVASARAILAFRMNPGLDPATALTTIDTQVEQAYAKTRIATAAQASADLLRQNILINLVQDASTIAGQRINDPASVMLATAKANATASMNTSFLTMGKIAEQALPMVRNVIEALIYAVFPFVFLLFLLAHGHGLGLAIKSFVMSLVWIQLWPPLYAILNYVATLASSRNLAAAARMDATTQGLALQTASSIYRGALSDQAVAGYMVISIPIIATAIIKGGEVAFQAISSVGAMQSAASGEGSATSKGNITQDVVSTDQQQLAPNRTSAYMSSTSDAHGTTTEGIGKDAGVFRYQANLSRLATTFTFSERQANSLTDSAREAETFARSERNAMQTSQATALTHALGVQDQYEKAQSRSGGSTTADGGATSSQVQTLNSVAREVNRRLGLAEESQVGKSVAASASAGATIPFTEIGGHAVIGGQQVDQEQLRSAYDFARHATQNTQLADATSLLREFRSSQAYQWSRSSKVAGSESFDSASREAQEHQSSSDIALSRAKELGRTAQFMREWSSGAQTDFTNYAAARLAERGLLREEDPIRLQRTVTEIASSYAQGGTVAGGFVPRDTPLLPSQAPSAQLGWSSEELGESYLREAGTQAGSPLREATLTNESELAVRQARREVQPSKRVSDEVSSSTKRRTTSATNTIEKARGNVGGNQGKLSDEYNASVQVGKISVHHGGNRAVWETAGAQSEHPTGLGHAPETSPAPPERHDSHDAPNPTPPTPTPPAGHHPARSARKPGHGAQNADLAPSGEVAPFVKTEFPGS